MRLLATAGQDSCMEHIPWPWPLRERVAAAVRRRQRLCPVLCKRKGRAPGHALDDPRSARPPAQHKPTRSTRRPPHALSRRAPRSAQPGAQPRAATSFATAPRRRRGLLRLPAFAIAGRGQAVLGWAARGARLHEAREEQQARGRGPGLRASMWEHARLTPGQDGRPRLQLAQPPFP
jgi:hypothetical protein